MVKGDAFGKLIDKRPEAIVGYRIGRAITLRDEWMEHARQTKHAEVRSHAVSMARKRHHELIQALRAL